MTFFIEEPDQLPRIVDDSPDLDVTDFTGGLGAAFSASALENDANFRLNSETRKSQFNTAQKAAELLGIDTINARGEEEGQFDHITKAPKTIDEAFHKDGQLMSERVLEMARADAKINPGKWADIDLSDEAIQTATDERLQAQHKDAKDTLDMMPIGSGRAAAELLGGMAGITLDIKNLPFIAMGSGAGSLRKVIMTEAVINAGAELATMPSQFKMAERLNIPDPSIATQLAMAAGAGAVLGGGIEATRRGLILWKGRNEIRTNSTSYDDIELSALIDRSEEFLDSDVPYPFEEVDNLRKANPPKPESTIDPLIAPDEATTSTLSSTLASISRGIDPDGIAAIELRSRGVTPETLPNLFSKKGSSDLIDLSPSELEKLLPGITVASRTSSDAPTLNREGLLDILAHEVEAVRNLPANDATTGLGTLGEALEGSDAPLISKPRRTSSGSFNSGKESDDPDPLFIDPGDYNTPDASQVIASDVQDWIDRRGLGKVLTRTEQDEVIAELQSKGGDASLLVNRVIERKAGNVDLPTEQTAPNNIIAFTRTSDQAFSDISSSEAKIIQDSVISDLQIHANDLGDLDLGDGAGVRPISEILDELEKEQEFLEIIALCGKVRR